MFFSIITFFSFLMIINTTFTQFNNSFSRRNNLLQIHIINYKQIYNKNTIKLKQFININSNRINFIRKNGFKIEDINLYLLEIEMKYNSFKEEDRFLIDNILAFLY